MGYIWTWRQSVAEDNALMRWLLGVRYLWQNPICDVPPYQRTLNEQVVQDGSGVRVDWPTELADTKINFGPPRQRPYRGSVGGYPVQMCDPARTESYWVDNKYGGLRVYDDGRSSEWTKAGERYRVDIPVEVKDGRAVEGYPNGNNTGDRHRFLIEPDGTAHEIIWLGIGTNTALAYSKYGPDGMLLDGIEGQGVVKGHQRITSLLWNRGDPPHRLGIVFKALGRNAMTGDGDSPEPYASWAVPAYGQLYRLSEHEYQRQLSLGPTDEQKDVLFSLRFHGVEPYDQGGTEWEGSIGMIGGAQWIGSTLGNLDVPLAELELVA